MGGEAALLFISKTNQPVEKVLAELDKRGGVEVQW